LPYVAVVTCCTKGKYAEAEFLQTAVETDLANGLSQQVKGRGIAFKSTQKSKKYQKVDKPVKV
jgi:hypothetical protein